MMWLKWLPWKFAVRKFARSRGFLDPIALLSRARRFSQPSEVMEPIELLRAGFAFHARGLMNSRAIQQNLDWVWPFWVQRQFNPRDRAFIPRAFSLTHINLTHRNWTAVGLPDEEELPIIDPRGLLTPFHDGWSLDAWIHTDQGFLLAPSRLDDRKTQQELQLDPQPAVITRTVHQGLALKSTARVVVDKQSIFCLFDLKARSEEPAWLTVSLRPYNPEGVNFIHNIALAPDRAGWLIEDKRAVDFAEAAEKHVLAQYSQGDVTMRLAEPENDANSISCDVGMATAAAMFRLEPKRNRNLRIKIDLRKGGKKKSKTKRASEKSTSEIWRCEMAETAKLSLPDSKYQFLYDAAVRSIILHSPGDVYPGPYTYKRFWFRDAAFILNAMLCIGLRERVQRALARFPARQTAFGYFRSQEGEWDSNGQALWIIDQYTRLGQRPISPELLNCVEKGAAWITRKRLPADSKTGAGGLLPAGFSAEHLGPNDFYYWDDFWAVAGLKAAADIMSRADKTAAADKFHEQAVEMMKAIEDSLERAASRLGRKAMPAAPARRLDPGAVGSLLPAYPLQLWTGNDPRLLDTVEYLINSCFLRNGFFQDMIHSGINPYLTLHVAQALLRAADKRFFRLARTTADIASPTGQWPEAVHPATLGGCMGDGQHIWAAAEWIMLIRNSFLYEEISEKKLILGAGIENAWLRSRREMRFGPALTRWGEINLRIVPETKRVNVIYSAQWHDQGPDSIDVRIPGLKEKSVAPRTEHTITVEQAK